METFKRFVTYKNLQQYTNALKDWHKRQPSVQKIVAGDKELPLENGAITLSKVSETGSYNDLTDKTHGYIDEYVSLGEGQAVKAFLSSFYGYDVSPGLNGDSVDFDLDIGYRYTVTIDGQTYNDVKCVGTDFNLENYGIPKTSLIGNTAMFHSTPWQDWELMTETFELPFLIIHERLKTSYKVWLLTSTSGSHQMEVSCTGYPNDSDELDSNIDTTAHTFTVTTGVEKQYSYEIPGTYPGWEHNNDFYANNNPLGSNVNACNLTTGKSLTVIFDGVEYQCTSYRYYDTETYVSSGYGYTTYFIGNWKLNSLFAPLISTMSARGANTYNSIPDNTDDYPFCFSCTWGKPTGASATQMDNMLFATTGGDHTLVIRSNDPNWSQLGPQYNLSEWDGGTFTLVGESTPATPATYRVPVWYRYFENLNRYEKDEETISTFEEGVPIKITYDGVEYDLVVKKDSVADTNYCGNPGLLSDLGDTPTDEPFLLVDGSLYLPDSEAGQLKSISGQVLNRSILKLDNKFLDNAILHPDWTEDDPDEAGYIENKPNLANIATSGNFEDLSKYSVPLIRSQWELSNVGMLTIVPVHDRYIELYVKYGAGKAYVYTTPPEGTLVFVRVEYSTDGSSWSRWQSEYIRLDGSTSRIRIQYGTPHEGNLDITDILGNSSYQYYKITALVVEAELGGNNGRASEIGSVYLTRPIAGQIVDGNAGNVTGGQVYSYVEANKGDTNVIESVSVNGTAQTITNKNVDIAVSDTWEFRASYNRSVPSVVFTQVKKNGELFTGNLSAYAITNENNAVTNMMSVAANKTFTDGTYTANISQSAVNFLDNADTLVFKIGAPDGSSVYAASYTVPLKTPAIADGAKGFVTSDQVYDYVNNASSLAGAMHFRGSVTSSQDLPANPVSGDVYISTATFTYNSEAIEPGDIFIYTNVGWAIIQGNIDTVALESMIPTNISELNNDEGYISMDDIESASDSDINGLFNT